jgi:hypothetical protein
MIQMWASRGISAIISVSRSPSTLLRLTSRPLHRPTPINATPRLQLSHTVQSRKSTMSLKRLCALLMFSRLLMQTTKSP